jgi:hypothetical protein
MSMFFNPKSYLTKRIVKEDSESLFKRIQEIKIRKNKYLYNNNNRNSFIFPKIKKLNEQFSFDSKFKLDKHSKILKILKIKNNDNINNNINNNKLKKSLSMIDMMTRNKNKIREIENKKILRENFSMGERLCNTKHAISCYNNKIFLPKIKIKSYK